MRNRLGIILLFILGVATCSMSQGLVCDNPTQICTGQAFIYPAITGSLNTQKYGCCSTTPNRAWFYFIISDTGDLNINMFSTPSKDIDFVCFGPYDSIEQACTLLDTAHILDCSYLGASNEMCELATTMAGKIYLLLVCNFSKQACTITVNQTSGNAVMNCLETPLVNNNGPLCDGDTLFLNADSISGASYFWTGPGNYSSTQQNPVVPGISLAQAGNYSLSITKGIFHAGPVTTQVTVMQLPDPEIITDTSICYGDSIYIGGTGITGNTYSWTSSPAGFSSSIYNPIVSPSASTWYILTQTTDQGCKSVDSAIITVREQPYACLTEQDSVCKGETMTLGCSEIPGNTFLWSSIPAGFISNLANPIITAIETMTYSLTETNTQTGCSKTREFLLTVVPIPSINQGLEQTICSGSTVQLGTPGTFGLSYQWSSQPSGFSSTVSNPFVTPLQTTIYTLQASTEFGCSSSSPVTVTVLPSPEAYTGPDQTICSGSPVNIGGPPVSGNTYYWTSIPAGYNTFISNPQVFPSQNTKFILHETITSNSCSHTDTVHVIVNPLPAVSLSPFTQAVCHDLQALQLSGGLPAGGTYYGMGISSGVLHPWLLSTGTYNITYQYTNSNNCTGYAFQNITIQNEPFIDGFIQYDNLQLTKLDSCKVTLLSQSGIPIDSLNTGASGHFIFNCLEYGSYKTGVKCWKSWGGVNALDALLVAKYFTGIITLTPLQKLAADVNGNQQINATDALLIMRRYIQTISSFPAGDWVTETDSGIQATLAGVDNNLNALCIGDVNGSYMPFIAQQIIPGKDIGSFLPLGSTGKSFSKSLVLKTGGLISSLSMILEYNPKEIEIEKITSTIPGAKFSDTGQQIRFAWYLPPGRNNDSGNTILSIEGKIKGDCIRPGLFLSIDSQYTGSDLIPGKLTKPMLEFVDGK